MLACKHLLVHHNVLKLKLEFNDLSHYQSIIPRLILITFWDQIIHKNFFNAYKWTKSFCNMHLKLRLCSLKYEIEAEQLRK